MYIINYMNYNNIIVENFLIQVDAVSWQNSDSITSHALILVGKSVNQWCVDVMWPILV